MGTNSAISVQELGKRYRIGEREPYGTLRDTVAQGARAATQFLRRQENSRVRKQKEHVWALDDVSFDVEPGEVVGLIGRNGAGKTTLLKVLSRITEPTAGEVRVRGSLNSLLEVGTGFHPELTGRENVYLNGAILGMRRAEIRRKFDEIVDFANVDQFIDTPIKRYSSGMQVRLAFAVAAHLESEILLVDEVLAVGDLEFQRKCMGRMEQASSMGGTVVFVSHSMASIVRLCPRVILLNRGSVIADGDASDVVRTYLESGLGTSAAREWSVEEAPGDDVARLRSVRVIDGDGGVSDQIDIAQPVKIEVTYWSYSSARQLGPTVTLKFLNEEGVVLFASTDMVRQDWYESERRPGIVRTVCTIPGHFLAEGQITVEVILASIRPRATHWIEPDVVAFNISDSTKGEGVRGPITFDWPGVVRPMLDWNIDFDREAETSSP
jgi:lipopolysaccharide transport system ATP-binding protein